MCSGQGSQYYQMGREFLDNPVFIYWMNRGSDLLQSLGRPGFLSLLYDTQNHLEWRDLLTSHPGLVIIEYALAEMLKAYDIVPDAVLGSSVGEFASAAIAGVLTFDAAVSAAFEQAKLILMYCPKGGMTAVLDSPETFDISHHLKNVQISAINGPKHFVISGELEALNEAHRLFKAKGIIYSQIPVDYAFHSKGIDMAEDAFKKYCTTQITLDKQKTSLISGLTGQVMNQINSTYFWDVVSVPFSFQSVIQTLEITKNTLYIDIGPSGNLAIFAKKNISPSSESREFFLLTPFHNGVKNMERLLMVLEKKNWRVII